MNIRCHEVHWIFLKTERKSRPFKFQMSNQIDIEFEG